jgi:hypothetical protein
MRLACVCYAFVSNNYNPCFPFRRHIFLISPPNVAIQVAMGVPRDGAHFLFGPHDQIINGFVIGLSTLGFKNIFQVGWRYNFKGSPSKLGCAIVALSNMLTIRISQPGGPIDK